MNIKLSDLTLIGWLIILLTIGIVAVLAIFSGTIWAEILPTGAYPAILLALPSLLIGVIFFFVSSLVLKAVGLPVIKAAPEQTTPSETQPKKE